MKNNWNSSNLGENQKYTWNNQIKVTIEEYKKKINTFFISDRRKIIYRKYYYYIIIDLCGQSFLTTSWAHNETSKLFQVLFFKNTQNDYSNLLNAPYTLRVSCFLVTWLCQTIIHRKIEISPDLLTLKCHQMNNFVEKITNEPYLVSIQPASCHRQWIR